MNQESTMTKVSSVCRLERHVCLLVPLVFAAGPFSLSANDEAGDKQGSAVIDDFKHLILGFRGKSLR